MDERRFNFSLEVRFGCFCSKAMTLTGAGWFRHNANASTVYNLYACTME